MSMAISRAKYTGDPGFFDFLKKAATIGTSFIPFVGPTISQAIARVGSSGPGIGPTQAAAAARCNAPGQYYLGPGLGCSAPGARSIGPQVGPIYQPPSIGPIKFPMPYLGTQRGPDPVAMAAMNGMMVGPGYHPNKSDYFLKSGEFVPKGSRMVKNRKRNPANARATSRAISRISGAKRYAKSLGRISIRKKC